MAAVFGGLAGSPAHAGRLFLGVIESLTKAYISTTLTDAVVFGILIIMSLVKPTGCSAGTERRRYDGSLTKKTGVHYLVNAALVRFSFCPADFY